MDVETGKGHQDLFFENQHCVVVSVGKELEDLCSDSHSSLGVTLGQSHILGLATLRGFIMRIKWMLYATLGPHWVDMYDIKKENIEKGILEIIKVQKNQVPTSA